MENKGELAPVRTRKWTSVDDYFEPRTEPEVPRFTLSTLPFLALFLGLAVLAIGIAVAAWPGSQPQPRPQAAQHEPGVAAKGWFQEAEKEMRRGS